MKKLIVTAVLAISMSAFAGELNENRSDTSIYLEAGAADKLFELTQSLGTETLTRHANNPVYYELRNISCFDWKLGNRKPECSYEETMTLRRGPISRKVPLSTEQSATLIEILQANNAPSEGHLAGIAYPVDSIRCQSTTGIVPIWVNSCTIFPGKTYTNPAE